MRILLLGTEMSWRGGENQTLLLARGLKGLGNQVFIAYPRGSRGLRKFGAEFEVVRLASPSPLDPRNWLRLSRFIKKNKIDILDAQSAKAHSLGVLLKGKGSLFRLVVHRRVDNPISKNWWTRKKYMSSKVDSFIGISKAIGEMLKEYGVAPNRIQIVRSAVDEEPYKKIDKNGAEEELRKTLRVGKDVLLVGSAAALSPQKGLDILIRACRELRDQGVNFRCLLAGEGGQESELKALSRELGLVDEVVFLGFIDHVPGFISGLDVFAAPSRNEGLGTVVLDAMLAETCVVASRVGGIPEMVIQGQTGLLVSPESVPELTSALLKLAQEPGFRKKLAAGAREWARAEFSLENMILGNLEVYEGILRGPTDSLS